MILYYGNNKCYVKNKISNSKIQPINACNCYVSIKQYDDSYNLQKITLQKNTSKAWFTQTSTAR